MIRTSRLILPIVFLFTAFVCGQTSNPAVPPVPSAENRPAAAPAFDVNAAVNAYLAKMPPAQRSRSDAYFEGGYWLLLWDFLSSVFVMWLMLRFRWSAGMRNLAERITRFRPLQTALYWMEFILVASILTFPLTVYEGYFREHKYGLLNQNLRSLDARADRRAGGRRCAGSDPDRAAIWACPTPGEELVGVGRGFDDRVSRIRKPDRPGLHRASLQQVQKAGGSEHQGSDPAGWLAPTEFPQQMSTSSMPPGNRIESAPMSAASPARCEFH